MSSVNRVASVAAYFGLPQNQTKSLKTDFDIDIDYDIDTDIDNDNKFEIDLLYLR